MTKFICSVVTCLILFGISSSGLFTLRNACKHVETTIPAVSATCVETGLTEGTMCEKCGVIINPQEVTFAKGHSEIKYFMVEATCESNGLTEGSHCSVCGKTLVEQEIIPATGHNVVVDAAVPATYENTGLTEGSHCTICGKVLVAQNVVPVKSFESTCFEIIQDDEYITDTITVNNNANYTVPVELQTAIYDTLAYYKKTYGIQASFTAISLEDYTRISYNADQQYKPASTLKAPYSLFVCKEIAAGNMSFDDTVTYQDYFWEVSYSPIKESAPGTKWTIRDIMYNTIHISDNTGYYMLRAAGGTSKYSTMLSDIGCTSMDAERPWSVVTPHDLSLLWNEIYEFGTGGSEEGQHFLDLLINAKYNFIKDGLNSYTKVAHKSGFNTSGYHDSAIIFGDSDPNSSVPTNNYIMTIMTKTYTQQINKVLLAELAKEIDAIMRDLTVYQNGN